MEQQTFFSEQDSALQPLAARLRPQNLSEFAGQTHLLGEGKVLRRLNRTVTDLPRPRKPFAS